MILILNTSTNTTMLGLYDSKGVLIQNDEWESGRQLSNLVLARVEALLGAQKAVWSDLSGIVVFRGPGSFTGLRIGITLANTLAYAQSIPIVGQTGEHWIAEGIKRLGDKGSEGQVLPHYGAPVNITKPRGTT